MNSRLGWLAAGGTVILALGILFEVSGLRARFLGRKRYRFVYATAASPADEARRMAQGGFEARTVQLPDGLRMETLVARARRPSGPWLIYFPGNDKAQLESGRKVLEAMRGQADVNLCALSYRGFSGSSGVPEVNDIKKDVTFAARFLIDHEKIGELHIVGFSIGAYFAAWTAAELAQAGFVAKSLTLMAPGYDLVMLRPSRFERLVPGDDYQMQPFLERIQSPTLVLQGTADDAFMGPEQGRRVHAEMVRRKGGAALSEYAEFEGLGHEAVHQEPAPLERARLFVANKLPG